MALWKLWPRMGKKGKTSDGKQSKIISSPQSCPDSSFASPPPADSSDPTLPGGIHQSSVPAGESGSPIEQRRRHHRADLRSSQQADPALQNHPDRATAAVNLKKAAHLEVTVDLLAEWAPTLEFLLQVHNEPLMANNLVMRKAIERYEHCWLPLLTQHGGEAGGALLAAPLDVAWAWWAHALCPLEYRRDVEAATGSSGSSGAWAGHLAAAQRRPAAAVEATRKLWNAAYPLEAYDADLKAVAAAAGEVHVSEMGYDIFAGMGRQHDFYYNVALPHYRESWFSERAVERYLQFLHLKFLHKTAFIVPPYDMDLLWHIHMACHVCYHADCMRLFNFVFPHDDAVNDRVSGGKLETSWNNTRDLWWSAYGTHIPVDGAMYRDSAPRLYTSPERNLPAAVHQPTGIPVPRSHQHFLLFPFRGDGSIVPAKPYDADPSDAVVVIIRAVPAEGGLSYIIILQHEGVDSQSAAVQVVEEGSDIVLASARLVGRETIPVANAETLLNTPALERDLQSPTQRSNLPPSPDCTASIKLPVCCKDSHQIVETGTEHGLISRGGENTTGASKYRDPEPLGSRASGCCGCVSPSSDERAFVISTAEADWGVSIGKWKSESAHVGSSCGQLQVQLHRLCDAKGTCTDVWRHRASSDEDINWAFHSSMDQHSSDADSCAAAQTTLLSICLGEGGRLPSVSAAAGEYMPAALVFAAAAALQAMMLGLATAPCEAANSPFWKGLLASSGVGPAIGARPM